MYPLARVSRATLRGLSQCRGWPQRKLGVIGKARFPPVFYSTASVEGPSLPLPASAAQPARVVAFETLEAMHQSTLKDSSSSPSVTAAEVLQKMQAAGQAYRHRPRQGVDYVVTDLKEINELFTRTFLTLEGIRTRKVELQLKLSQLSKEIATLEKLKAELDAKAVRAPLWFSRAGFVFLVVQWAVLFRFVFFTFDWNLIEPVTYFVGYTAMMTGILWYSYSKQEFDYNTVHEVLTERKRRKLYTKAMFDEERLQKLKEEWEATKTSLSQLALDPETPAK